MNVDDRSLSRVRRNRRACAVPLNTARFVRRDRGPTPQSEPVKALCHQSGQPERHRDQRAEELPEKSPHTAGFTQWAKATFDSPHVPCDEVDDA